MSRSSLCHGCAFGTITLWAFAFVYTKVAAESFSPTALALLRCLVACGVLALFLALKRSNLPRLRDLPLFVLSGAFGFGLYLPVFNKGLESLTAATSCILLATAPVMTALMAAALFRERLSFRAWAAMGIQFCGILILSLWNGTLAVNSGVLWTLAAAALLSGYNILQRMLSARYTSLDITAHSFFTGTLMLLVFAGEAASQAAAAPAGHLWVIIFLGVFPSAIAYLLWAKALVIAKKTSDVTNYMFVTPLVALLLGYMVIAEMPDAGAFVGGAVIFSGLALFTTAGRKHA